MRNIMKAQFYQLFRDGVFQIMTIFCVSMYCAIGVFAPTDEKISGGMKLMQSAEVLTIFGTLMILVYVSRTCGWDFQDKTINYEVVSGHKRSEVFFARLCVSFLLSFMAYTVFWGLPVLYGTICGGWGYNLNAAHAFIRIGLGYAVIFRVMGLMVLLNFLLRSSVISIVVGYIGLEICAMPSIVLEEFLKIGNGKLYWTSSMTSILAIFDFTNTKTGFLDGKDITIAVADVSGSFATNILISSFVVGITSLVIAYFHFQKTDMK